MSSEIVPVETQLVGVSAAEQQLMNQLERAGELLAEARTLDAARNVEGFLKATLEWAKRQERISIAAFNDAKHLWLEAQARQGELLRDLERNRGGRPETRTLNERVVAEVPTLKELGYRRVDVHRLQQIASVHPEERIRIYTNTTAQDQKLTQKALLEAAKAAQYGNGKSPPIPPEDRSPCPVELPEQFHNCVVTGDARELAAQLPDESVAICFCDPVYDRLDDYEWLAKECERVLVPGGSLIVQCGNLRRFDCEVAMRRSGLKFVDLLAEVYPYALTGLFHIRVNVGWKPYLWFSRGPRKSGWVMNRLMVGGKTYAEESKQIHRWGDSEQFAAKLLGKLCEPGDLMWDPFTGSGTVPVVAAKLGLPFVAFEIDPETAQQARDRVAGTPRVESPQQQMGFEEEEAAAA